MGVKKASWETYGKGKEWWSIIHHELAFDVGYEKPGVKWFASHVFAKRAACTAVFERTIAGWKAAGFRKLTAREVAAIPRQSEGAYLGLVLPFPDDAHYFRHGKTIHAVIERDEVVIKLFGAIGKNFGELATHYYPGTTDDMLAHYRSQPAYKELTREKVIALYKSSKSKKAVAKKR